LKHSSLPFKFGKKSQSLICPLCPIFQNHEVPEKLDLRQPNITVLRSCSAAAMRSIDVPLAELRDKFALGARFSSFESSQQRQ